MLISFSGPQCSGKTTLLKHLQQKNSHVSFVPEVTRLIKRDYNLPINEDGNDITQTMIMGEHLRNALKNDIEQVSYILDRCSLDGLVYTHWLCDRKAVSMGVYSLASLIFKATIAKYDMIFYTSPDDVVLEDDGERSINVQFRDDITKLFDAYINDFSIKVVILKGDVVTRLETIQKVLKEKGLEINI